MKNFAKLTLFFSIFFAVFFSLSVLLKFVSLWIDFARTIPAETRTGREVAEIAWQSLSVALHVSILLALSYTARRKIPVFAGVISIIFLAYVFTSGVSLAINRTGAIESAFQPGSPIRANPGLIVSQNENSIILLQGSNELRGPRLVSIPGRPLIYQSVPIGPNNTILSLPAISFGNDVPWLIRSINIDFSLNARELQSRFGESYLSFAIYAFSLILLLSSLRFLIELSQWPLANIVLGMLIFRLILSLEVFINSQEINTLITSFLGGRVPSTFITPLVFCTLGALALLYTLLARVAASPRGARDD